MPYPLIPGSQPDGLPREYSAKIKEQTRKLATDSSKHCFELADKTNEGSSKHCFEVADKTDQVRNIYLESGNADMSCFLILEEYKRF